MPIPSAGHPEDRLSFLKVFVPLHTPSFPSFPPPSSGVRLAGRHLSRWGVVGQVTFVCHCFAPHTSPREQGRSLAYSTCHRLHRRPARYRRSAGELDVPTEKLSDEANGRSGLPFDPARKTNPDARFQMRIAFLRVASGDKSNAP